VTEGRKLGERLPGPLSARKRPVRDAEAGVVVDGRREKAEAEKAFGLGRIFEHKIVQN
jgi:hypothetical protein